MLLLYAIPAGILIGLARGGRLSELGRVHIRLWPLAVGGLVFQLLLFAPPLAQAVGAAGPALYVGSTLLVLLALAANLSQPGFRMILAGSLLNMAVILANGGQMPVTAEALAAVHGMSHLPTGTFTNSVLAGATTPLALLGDVFVLPRPLPFANAFSIGDVLIGAGGAWFVAQVMRGRHPRLTPARAAHA